MPNTIINSALLGLALTFGLYYLGEKLSAYLKTSLLPPFLTSSLLIILLITFVDSITLQSYEIGGNIIAFFLGPATISFALPLKKNWEVLKANVLPLLLTAIVGSITAIIATFYCAKLFGASELTLLSLAPKSITTPIAMELSQTLGGLPPLTIVCVSLAGVFGAVFGHSILKVCGVTDDIAIGFAIGTASHALGTSSCVPVSAKQVTFGSLAIVLLAITTTLVAPFILTLLK